MNLLVVHLTQGGTLAGAVTTLRNNRSWSNTVFDPATNDEYVFTESPDGDRSLRNLSGGVETNNRPGVYQIEIVGYSERVRGYDDQWYERLETYLRRKCTDWDVPYVFPYEFKDAQAAYGVNSSTRLTAAQWMAATGIVGHQHVPENTHWDPGPIDVARLNTQTPDYTPPKETTTMDQHCVPANREPIIRESQQVLADAGFYDGAIDGDWYTASNAGLHGLKNALADAKTRLAELDVANEALGRTVTNRDNSIAILEGKIAELEAQTSTTELTATQLESLKVGDATRQWIAAVNDAGGQQ